MAKKTKTLRPYVAEKAWEIYPQPLLMTDTEVRVQFYVKDEKTNAVRHVANGMKNRLDDKYAVMLVPGERQKLMDEYGFAVNQLYRFFDSELRRIVALMESHPEKYLRQSIVTKE